MRCFSRRGEISYRCHNDVFKDKIDLRVSPTQGYTQVIPEKLEISTSEKEIILITVQHVKLGMESSQILTGHDIILNAIA